MFMTEGKNEKLPTVNITIQNSIFSEALDTYNHAFGSTIGGLNTLFARNLWANNISRNPSFGMYGDFNFVNNVVFNWWNRSADGGDNRSYYNFINNYYKPDQLLLQGANQLPDTKTQNQEEILPIRIILVKPTYLETLLKATQK